MTGYRRFLCFAVAAAFWGTPSFAQSRDAEAARVYSAAFDFLFGQYKGEFPRTIVLMDSTSWDAGSVAYNGVLLKPHASVVDPETIRDFELLSRQHTKVTKADFSYRLPIVLLTLREYFRLDTLGRAVLHDDVLNGPQPGTLMDEFARQFPHAWGISAVSRVGLNSARTQAMVLVANSCGQCFHSETLVFRKREGKWVLQERIPITSNDGIGPGETRYLGVNPQRLPRLRRTQDSTKRAVADSMGMDKAPRRISGTITNRQTGRPIPFAQVLLFQSHPDAKPDTVPHPDARVVADRRGRYTISNPAVGGATVAILCPGKVYFDRPSLGAPGLYVSPGTDTTFNFAAQDLSACWVPTKPHRLESGWLESAEARNAPVPDGEESRVMRVAIDHLREADADARIVGMFTRTTLPCRFDRFCGVHQLPRLVQERVIDSAAAKNFRSESAKRTILNPAFAASVGLHVITDAEFSYLSGEATWPLGWPAGDAQTDSVRFWRGLRALYGPHAAIAAVTRVGFNTSRTQALVEARLDTAHIDWMRGQSKMLILRKTNDEWVIVDDNVGAGTTSGAIEGNSCVASSAPSKKVSLAEIEPIDGLFELTIVASGLNERTQKMRVRIGHNLPARWIQPPAGVTSPPPSPGHSFELLGLDGRVDLERTMETGIDGISRNVLRDPAIIQLDGFYQNLTILNITDTWFGGSYVAGVFGDSDFGYFCARRVK
jgi:hypothetical protein